MGVESGPAVGGMANIVNEGPVRGSLEGFKPMNIKPLGEIVFNQSSLTAESAISQAEAIIAEVRVSSPINKLDTAVTSLTPSVIPAEAGIHLNNDLWILNQVQDDKVAQSEARRVTRSIASPSISNQTESVYAPTIQEQLVQEVVQVEETEVENRVEESSGIKEKEETEELKIKYVEDEEVSKRRIYQLGQSIERADAETKKEGKEGIEGSLLKRFFAAEDSSNRSPIAKPGIGDGGLEKIYQLLSGRDYSSAEEAIQAAGVTVEDIKAVRKSKEGGKKVKERDVALARKDPVLKRHPVEEVVARIIKKTKVEIKPGQKPVEVTTIVQTEDFAEPKIGDYPELSKVFQKAA